MITSGLQEEERGGSRRAVKSAVEHEKNVSMAGNQIFRGNISSILMQALLQNYNILDCMTIVDLCEAPPTIEVKHASGFLAGEDMRGEEYDHTKRIMDRNRQNGALTVACITLAAARADDCSNAILIKTFPALAAPGGSWTAAQAEMKEHMGYALAEMMHHPEEIEKQLKTLRRARQ